MNVVEKLDMVKSSQRIVVTEKGGDFSDLLEMLLNHIKHLIFVTSEDN